MKKTHSLIHSFTHSPKLWGGRFQRKTQPAVERFTHSFAVDCRLARHDLLGSIAHARMLGRRRILSRADSARLVRGLTGLLRALERGKLKLDPAAEDVHTAIQQALERKVGLVAGRLHTARSRNDQVVTAFRLACRETAGRFDQQIGDLQRAILRQASRAGNRVMPGYTHLRHAQPVLIAHLLLSYLPPLDRDRQRLQQAKERLNELPLGSGALAGSSLPIDRAFVAKQLGFARIMENSIDGVTDRDFVAEMGSALALLGVHLSRIAEDLILWSAEEFGFLRFDESMLTGSSMMPQKQNPDFLELTRAGAARVIGNQTAILTLLKGLSSGYQRDLQMDKTFLFEMLDQVEGMLAVMTMGFQTIRWNTQALRRALADDALCATDLAEYLVGRGIPFTDAHRAVGRLLAHADREKTSLRALPVAEWKRFSPAFGAEALRLLDPSVSVRRKRSIGSTNPTLVSREINRWKRSLRGANATKQSHH